MLALLLLQRGEFGCSAKGSSRDLDHCRTKTTCSVAQQGNRNSNCYCRCGFCNAKKLNQKDAHNSPIVRGCLTFMNVQSSMAGISRKSEHPTGLMKKRSERIRHVDGLRRHDGPAS